MHALIFSFKGDQYYNIRVCFNDCFVWKEFINEPVPDIIQ
jgi:hypothetical protein